MTDPPHPGGGADGTLSLPDDKAMELLAVLFPHSMAMAMFGVLCMLLSFAGLAIFEILRPARPGMAGRAGRITVNFGLGLVNMAISAILPLSSVAVAAFAQGRGWGLFRLWPVPMWICVLLLLLAKSLLDYGLHRLFHRSAWLWPLHAVHHGDDAVDLSTAFRSHPFNHATVLVANALPVLLLGPEIWAALVAESILFLAVLFHHANLQVPDNVSARLESWLVTPRMHLVHHAGIRDLHDSNYGELFTVWDHVFGTYRTPPPLPFAIGVGRHPAGETR